jgi:hypothetical protein
MVPSQYLPGGKYEETSVRKTSLLVKITTKDLPNIKQAVLTNTW